MRRALRRLWYALRQRQSDADLAEEMAVHREMAERELAQRGAAPPDARLGAERLFGSAALARDRSRDVWIPPALQDITRDVRFAVRLLTKDRGFTFAAVMTLALGIGAAGTIFTIFDGMFLKGLPVDRPDRIVAVRALDCQGRPLQLSPAAFDDWRTATESFRGLAAYAGATAIIADEGRPPERVAASYISATAFTLLGERPLLGRVFTADDDRRGAPPVVILGEGVWQDRDGGDPRIIGRPVTVNDEPVTVIGVMPARFRFPMIDKAWLPLAMAPQVRDRRRDARTLAVVGRLADGITIPQARAELDAIATRLAHEYPDTDAGLHAAVEPYTGGFSGFDNPWSDALLAAGFLLLIGCANVASLLLARAAGRGRDLAIRTALGATRWRVLRQLVVESTLLSTVAGCVGLALTWAGVRLWIVSMPVANWPYWFRWDFDARVLAFLTFVSAATAVLAGATPARTAVAALTIVRNASTRASKSHRNQYGQFATGIETIQSRTPAHVRARPTQPATVESSVLSTTSCRRTRHRVAPSAVRIARSRPRPAARASSRLATLAQPMSRRKPAASSASLHGLSNPRKPPVYGSTAACRPASVSGYSRARRVAMASSSARACGIVMPSASRPTTASVRASRRRSRTCGAIASGSHALSIIGNLKRAGITPITVTGSSLTVTGRPMIRGSPPYRSCQTPSPRMTTGGAPRRSSSAVKTRPRSGRSPSSVNAVAEK